MSACLGTIIKTNRSTNRGTVESLLGECYAHRLYGAPTLILCICVICLMYLLIIQISTFSRDPFTALFVWLSLYIGKMFTQLLVLRMLLWRFISTLKSLLRDVLSAPSLVLRTPLTTGGEDIGEFNTGLSIIIVMGGMILPSDGIHRN